MTDSSAITLGSEPGSIAAGDPLVDLVSRFSNALLDKLQEARFKYGFDDKEWRKNDWQDSCLRQFHHHIEKGDPRDVAAYCAFMWHHDWSTVAQTQKTVHNLPVLTQAAISDLRAASDILRTNGWDSQAASLDRIVRSFISSDHETSR